MNQKESEQNEVDEMRKGDDSTGDTTLSDSDSRVFTPVLKRKADILSKSYDISIQQ